MSNIAAATVSHVRRGELKIKMISEMILTHCECSPRADNDGKVVILNTL